MLRSGRHRLVKRALSRSQLSGTGKHYAHAEPWYAVGDMENDDESETLNMNWRFMRQAKRARCRAWRTGERVVLF